MNEDVKQAQVADVSQRTAEFEKELTELQRKFSLKMNVSLEFPMYRILPDELKLALAVLNKHTYIFQRSYTDLKGGTDNANVSGNADGANK